MGSGVGLCEGGRRAKRGGSWSKYIDLYIDGTGGMEAK